MNKRVAQCLEDARRAIQTTEQILNDLVHRGSNPNFVRAKTLFDEGWRIHFEAGDEGGDPGEYTLYLRDEYQGCCRASNDADEAELLESKTGSKFDLDSVDYVARYLCDLTEEE